MSAVMPIMSTYRLSHGQYGYSGHVINFRQDVKSFATKLPHLPSEIDVLVERREREQSHCDFRVRRRVVEEALTWLLTNNIYYRTIGIIMDQDTLAEDGHLTDLPSVQPEEGDETNETPPTNMTSLMMIISLLHLYLQQQLWLLRGKP